MSAERRAFPRAKFKWPVVVNSSERSIEGVTLNVGPDGVFIGCKKPLKLNEIIGTAVYIGQSNLDDAFATAKRGIRLARFDDTLPEDGRWLVPLPHPSGASLWPNKPENKALIERAANILGQIRNNWNL